MEEITDVDADLEQLVNTLQRHEKCSEGKCLRVSAKGDHVCRYGFPKPPCERTRLKVHKISDHGATLYHLEVEHKRNDILINNYNDVITHVWRSNTDIQFIVATSKQALKFYVMKYNE